MYLRRILISLDQLVNTIFDGDPDETISSRVGRAAVRGEHWGLRLEILIDFLLGQGHCRNNIEKR